MIEAKGTREEWVNFIGKFAICKEDKAAILREVELHGWITKPEWEQAYDDTIKLANSNSCGISEKFTCAMNAVRLMRDRIVELEKKLEKGE